MMPKSNWNIKKEMLKKRVFKPANRLNRGKYLSNSRSPGKAGIKFGKFDYALSKNSPLFG